MSGSLVQSSSSWGVRLGVSRASQLFHHRNLIKFGEDGVLLGRWPKCMYRLFLSFFSLLSSDTQYCSRKRSYCQIARCNPLFSEPPFFCFLSYILHPTNVLPTNGPTSLALFPCAFRLASRISANNSGLIPFFLNFAISFSLRLSTGCRPPLQDPPLHELTSLLLRCALPRELEFDSRYGSVVVVVGLVVAGSSGASYGSSASVSIEMRDAVSNGSGKAPASNSRSREERWCETWDCTPKSLSPNSSSSSAASGSKR